MYLSRDNRTDVLIEQILKALKLVDEGKLDAVAAFYVVVEQAKEHPDWPEEEEPVSAPVPPAPSIDVRRPDVAPAEPTPEPTAVAVAPPANDLPF